MSPALNRSFAQERFKSGNVIEICNGMMFNFYPEKELEFLEQHHLLLFLLF